MTVQQLNLVERFLEQTNLITPEALERVVRFRFDPGVERRAAELAEKANEGTLSEDEQAEYAEYIEAVDLIGIIQASAKSVLQKHVG